jgi:hypothetical protein
MRGGTKLEQHGAREAEKRLFICQHCYGAPGMVTTFADAPFARPEFDALLLDGGRFAWAAGPLTKGSNLCHGTGGNGYAFLKLYRRTNDPIWLDRARQFAMTAIFQYRGAQMVAGRGRYTFGIALQGTLGSRLSMCSDSSELGPLWVIRDRGGPNYTRMHVRFALEIGQKVWHRAKSALCHKQTRRSARVSCRCFDSRPFESQCARAPACHIPPSRYVER